MTSHLTNYSKMVQHKIHNVGFYGAVELLIGVSWTADVYSVIHVRYITDACFVPNFRFHEKSYYCHCFLLYLLGRLSLR